MRITQFAFLFLLGVSAVTIEAQLAPGQDDRISE